jgi:tetratricopeptide (TPR) repeat protein
MPPWLPVPGYGEFQHSRRLSNEEKTLLLHWVTTGSAEGNPAETPPAPQWPDGWTLGKPDLVVKMKQPYVLGADGSDLYRNFIIPVPTDRDHYVRAIEFAPGNSKIVHHAFIKLDSKRACRRLDGEEGSPGFSGMNMPAEMPDGQFLTWQPGKLATPGVDGIPWLLPKGSDLILQAHLNRTGKPETLQSSVALYFTEQPPAKACFKMALLSLALDIPQGDSNYVVQDTFRLPVAADLLSILPHAHYLARHMQGYATLPNGERKGLIWIKQWDFRWQGEYVYAHPVHLPAGTTLQLAFTYDNSTNNLHNSGHPLQRVVYGPKSSDEMCELWFQLVPQQRTDLPVLKQAYDAHVRDLFAAAARHRIQVNPADADAYNELGLYLCDQDEITEGLRLIERAITLNPKLAGAHVNRGAILRMNNRLPEAQAELETALRLDPQNARAYGHLGFIHASLGNAEKAHECFVRSLAIDPDDSLIQDALRELEQWQRAHH